MIISKDVYLAANSLILQHGKEDALDYAISRVEDLFDEGDEPGMKVWSMIVEAIKAIDHKTFLASNDN